MDKEIVLKVEDLCKNFGPVKVLEEVNFTLKKGEVLGLVGENGAGKSTLMNVLGGIHPKSSGYVELFGRQYEPQKPEDATNAGIAFIHQELNLFTNLTVAENIFIDKGRANKPFLSRKEINEEASRILGKLGLSVDPNSKVEKLTMGMRQMVEIAKAVAKDAKIIFFDEPTTSLSPAEKGTLFELIQEFSKKGISMIYISHALEDVVMLCDEILVLRDGKTIGEQAKIDTVTLDEIVSRMVGRRMEQMYPYVEKNVGETILSVEHICQGRTLQDVSFQIKKGEIVGLFGLMGAGRSELAHGIFGTEIIDSGDIQYKGNPVKTINPQKWVQEGAAFITENRRDEGLLLKKSVSENLVLCSLSQLGKHFGVLDSKKQIEVSKKFVEELRIKTDDVMNQKVCNLSGGNQQKVVIGKWLMIEPEFIILDEPTRGVDVGAKEEIYHQINHMALQGTGVLFISSEMEELIGVCDRILIMHKGQLTGELKRNEFTQDTLLKYAIGELSDGEKEGERERA